MFLACLWPVQFWRSERGDRKGNPSFLGAFHEVVAGPSNSTVRILCKKGDKDEEVAYGAIVGADGWIITKASELKDRPVMCRLKDGRELTAKVVGVENRTDLALLKVDAKNLKPVVWGDSKTAVPGNWVAVPGLNSEPVAVGVVSVAARKVTAAICPSSTAATSALVWVPRAKKAVRKSPR